MTWKTHLIGGVVASAGIIQLYYGTVDGNVCMDMDTLASVLVISGVSALLPDVDEINSKTGRILLPVSLIFFIMQSMVKIAMVFTCGKVRKKIKANMGFWMHRGVCHYPITILFVSFIACAVTIILPCDKKMWLMRDAAFTMGLSSHIILDVVSGKIALLYPFSKKKFGIRAIESGGALEKMIVRPVLLMLCIVTMTRIVR